MPSNRSKYSEGMRTHTAAYILESGNSLTYVVEKLENDVNAVCRWLIYYRGKREKNKSLKLMK